MLGHPRPMPLTSQQKCRLESDQWLYRPLLHDAPVYFTVVVLVVVAVTVVVVAVVVVTEVEVVTVEVELVLAVDVRASLNMSMDVVFEVCECTTAETFLA